MTENDARQTCDQNGHSDSLLVSEPKRPLLIIPRSVDFLQEKLLKLTHFDKLPLKWFIPKLTEATLQHEVQFQNTR